MNKEFPKRAFCLILVLALSLTLFPVTASAAAPSDPLTRGIFFQLLAEVLYWNISDPDENPFRDLVEAAPYCNALLTAYEKGYVNGYSNGTIRPDAYMTKADAATIFYRIGGWKKARRGHHRLKQWSLHNKPHGRRQRPCIMPLCLNQR